MNRNLDENSQIGTSNGALNSDLLRLFLTRFIQLANECWTAAGEGRSFGEKSLSALKKAKRKRKLVKPLISTI